MTKWVSTLIGTNIVLFALQQMVPGLTNALALVPALALLRPWTLFTYMFLHESFGHIFFNMLALYFFGPRLELVLGSRRFLTLYLASGLGGALLSFLPMYYSVAIIGASGAVMGVMTAYATMWPRDRIYLYGVVPVQAWWLVAGYATYSIIGAVNPNVGAGTAHLGHLGGIVVGLVYMTWLTRNSAAKRFQQQAVAAAPIVSESEALRRWGAIPVAELHELNRGEVIRLLEKVRTQGVKSLTLDERATLDRYSRA